MADAFYGEIRAFTFNYAPRDWAYCWGQKLPIAQYGALYSVIGALYGGDQQTFFNIPDLSGRVTAEAGTATVGNITVTLDLAAAKGASTVSITQANMPLHSHQAVSVQTKAGITAGPTANSFVSIPRLDTTKVYDAWTPYASATNLTTLSPASVDYFGASQVQAHDNVSPYLALNFCICINDGVYPRRP